MQSKGLVSVPTNARVILTVARLVERKGIDKVIESMPFVKKHFPNSAYFIAGDGPFRSHLKQLAKKSQVSSSIFFRGFVSEEEKVRLYQACDVFIMPSRVVNKEDVEGFGIVFLEASACRKPVIGGNSGGIGDAIVDGQTGIIVEAEDISSIASSIISLLANDDYRVKMGENGYQRVRDHYTWTRIASDFKQSIQEALAER
jgi:phosphatidylinositol alpha-1,6-mannosyltransferase